MLYTQSDIEVHDQLCPCTDELGLIGFGQDLDVRSPACDIKWAHPMDFMSFKQKFWCWLRCFGLEDRQQVNTAANLFFFPQTDITRYV